VENGKLPDDVFAGGYEDGAGMTLQMLTYKERGYTDNMRMSGGDMPSRDLLPLDGSGRRDWLTGYAAGILAVLHTFEILEET
jgi:hypothetical protein